MTTAAPNAHESPLTTNILTQDTFLLRLEHRDFVLGHRQTLASGNRFLLGCVGAFFSVFVCFGIGMMVMTLRDTYEWFVIMQQGMTTTAEYIDRRISSSDDSDSYYVSYEYTVANNLYTYEQHVSEDIYNRAEVGGRVDIVYARSNPEVAAVQGTNNPPIGFILFSLVWNGLIFAIIWLLIKFSRQQKLLEKNGRLIRGEVLQSTQTKDSDGDLILKVEYKFQAPESYQVITKTERAQRNDLKDTPLPERGTPVLILYNNEKHFMLL